MISEGMCITIRTLFEKGLTQVQLSKKLFIFQYVSTNICEEH